MKFKDLAFLFEEAESFGEWVLAAVIAILIVLVYMAIVGAIVAFLWHTVFVEAFGLPSINAVQGACMLMIIRAIRQYSGD